MAVIRMTRSFSFARSAEPSSNPKQRRYFITVINNRTGALPVASEFPAEHIAVAMEAAFQRAKEAAGHGDLRITNVAEQPDL